MLEELRRINLQLFAEEAPVTDGAPDSGVGQDKTDGAPPDEGAGQQQPENVSMTQAQLDDLINKAFARGARKGKKEAEQAAPPSPDGNAQPPEAGANEALRRAHAMLISAALRTAAVEAGFIDPSDAAALVDRSVIEIDDDGNVDGAEDAIKALLKAKPHLAKRKESGPVGGGVNGGTKASTKEPLGAQIAKRRQESVRRADKALEPFIRR